MSIIFDIRDKLDVSGMSRVFAPKSTLATAKNSEIPELAQLEVDEVGLISVFGLKNLSAYTFFMQNKVEETQ